MKNFLTKISFFILLTVGSYLILVCLWGTIIPRKLNLNLLYRVGSPDFMFTRVQEISSAKDIDVLFLGSSHAYRGFDPRIFEQAGHKTFTLASSSQSPMQTQLLLERHLDRLAPKTVVYEVYPATFCSDGVESALNIIANDKNDVKSLKMAFQVNNVKVYNTLIYGYFCDLINKNENFRENSVNGEESYVTGGYVETKTTVSKVKLDNAERKWEFNSRQFEAFETTLALLKRKNIRVILVYAPIAKERYKSYVNNEEFENKMRKYGKVYDFNKLMSIDESYFTDADHLNQEGVKKFNMNMLAKVSLE